MQEERLGEVAAGRVARDDDLALGDADVVDEVVVAGERLDELGRVAELGRELCEEERQVSTQLLGDPDDEELEDAL